MLQKDSFPKKFCSLGRIMNFGNDCIRGLAIIFVLCISSAFGASLKPCLTIPATEGVEILVKLPGSTLTVFNHADIDYNTENPNEAILPSGTRLTYFKHGTYFTEKEADFLCNNGNLANINDRAELVSNLMYRQGEKPTPLRNGKLERSGQCENQGTTINVLIEDSETGKSFIDYSVCFDEATSTTLYSKSVIDGYSLATNKDKNKVNRPNFQDQGFFPFNVNKAYTKKQVAYTLEKLLGQESFETYFPDDTFGKGALYIARGHLHPNADPVTVIQKKATFFFVNVVPQWQALNNGNWKAVEESFRTLAVSLKSEIKVWTGTHDVLHMRAENQENVEVWLQPETKSGKRLPVPKFLWKVGYSEEQDAAIALIQINDPFAVENENDVLCKDICDQVPWLTKTLQLNRGSFKKGYTYCCDVNELRKQINIVPELKYSKKLLGLGDTGQDNFNIKYGETDKEDQTGDKEDEGDKEDDYNDKEEDDDKKEEDDDKKEEDDDKKEEDDGKKEEDDDKKEEDDDKKEEDDDKKEEDDDKKEEDDDKKEEDDDYKEEDGEWVWIPKTNA